MPRVRAPPIMQETVFQQKKQKTIYIRRQTPIRGSKIWANRSSERKGYLSSGQIRIFGLGNLLDFFRGGDRGSVRRKI
jgi:hypothetical protein